MSSKIVSPERKALAQRLKQVRTEAGYTQEKFAEIFDISVNSYKKLETAENQMTVAQIRILNKEFHISADYMLFGEKPEFEETWKLISNSSEKDKMHSLLRLFAYFAGAKEAKRQSIKDLAETDEKILRFLELIDEDSKKDEKKGTDC